MAPRQKKVDELKAKEAKQKKILAVLGVLLVVLMVIQGPKLLKHGPPQVASTTPTTPATTTPAVTGSAATLPPPSTAGTPGATVSPAGGASLLADTDTAPAADAGQLVDFSLFASKDPFVQQVGGKVAAPKPTADTPVTPDTPSPDGGLTTPPSTAPSGSTTSIATISVNGKTEDVALSGTFPANDPVFRLESIVSFSVGSRTTLTATITIVGGSYADGAKSLTLHKGKPVTLQNTGDGTRYTILLLGRTRVPTASLPNETTTTTSPPAMSPLPTTPTPSSTPTTPTNTTPTG